MSGEYTFYVAHTLPTESITLCDTAVIGTTFIRDVPVAENLEFQAGSTATLSVSHIYAADTIGNVLAINLRLASDSELTTSSVSLVNDPTATEVTIDTTGIAAGTYSLKLESIDENSGVFSTLKTDIVTIVVVGSPPTTTSTEPSSTEIVLEVEDPSTIAYVDSSPTETVVKA